MEDKGYFSKVCSHRFIWCWFSVSSDKNVLSSPWYQEDTFLMGNLGLLLGRKGQGRMFLNGLEFKIMNIPKWHIVGGML